MSYAANWVGSNHLSVSLPLTKVAAVLSGVSVLLNEETLHHFRSFTVAHGVTQHCLRCSTVVYRGGFVSYSVTHCHPLGWLCAIPSIWLSSLGLLYIVLGIPLPFTRVALHHSMFPTAAHCSCLQVILGPTVAYWSGSVSFHVYLCHSQ